MQAVNFEVMPYYNRQSLPLARQTVTLQTPQPNYYQMKDAVKHSLLAFALVSYVIAFFCPVMETTDPDGYSEQTLIGYEALLYGWLTILALWPTWFANPLICIALFLQSRGHFVTAHRTAAIALLCAISIFLYYNSAPRKLTESAREDFDHFVRFGAWFWLASIMALWIRSLIALSDSRKLEQVLTHQRSD